MVLRSQVARQGIRWRYMAGGSGRRRGLVSRWPWALLSLAILGGVSYVIWNGSASSVGVSAAIAAGNNNNEAQTEPASEGADDSDASANQGYRLPPPGTPGNQDVGSAAALPANRSSRNLPADHVWTLDGTLVEAKPIQKLDAKNTPPAAMDKTVTSNPPAPVPAAAAVVPSDIHGDAGTGFSLIEQGHRVEGRKLLSKLLVEGSLTPAEAQKARDVLTIVNNTLIYSPRQSPEETLTQLYAVQRGDRLVNIAIKFKTPHQFIEKINGIDANHIQLEQKLKVVKGPFHVVVGKSAFRMDVFLKDPADGQLLYIRSFPVGLGTDDSTPLGDWVIRPRSKVVNPGWTNPRTGQTFTRDDPKNPVGEFWMGLEGVSAQTANLSGYGIHGTIDQNSIGTQSSMGCIRLRDEDIAQLYYMLWEGESTVQIVK